MLKTRVNPLDSRNADAAALHVREIRGQPQTPRRLTQRLRHRPHCIVSACAECRTGMHHQKIRAQCRCAHQFVVKRMDRPYPHHGIA